MAEHNPKAKSSFAANIAFSVLAWGAPLVFAFIATPFLIRGLGLEQYGYYALVLAVIGFGFTTGIGKASAKYIPEFRASNQENDLSKFLFATLLLTIATALIQGVILALAAPFIVETTLNVPLVAQNELKTAVYVACLIGPVMMTSQFFQSAAQGLQLFRGSSLITIIVATALNCGSIFLATGGFPYSQIFIWNLIVVATALAAYGLFVKKYLPELRLLFGVEADVLKKVGRFAASIFVYQTITSVLFIFERAFVLRNFGSEAVTYYTVPLMLGVYLHALIVSFSQVVVPKLNERLGDSKELAEFYKLSTKIVLSLTVLIFAGYCALGRMFLTLWLSEDFGKSSFSFLVLHGAAFGVLAVSVNCWILAEASHRPGMNALSSSVTSVLGVVTILLVSVSWGLEGVASGRLIGAVAVLPLIPYLEAKVFGSPMISFWLVNLGKVTLSFLCAYVVGVYVGEVLPESWLSFVVSTVLLTFVFVSGLILLRFFSLVELKQTVPTAAG